MAGVGVGWAGTPPGSDSKAGGDTAKSSGLARPAAAGRSIAFGRASGGRLVTGCGAKREGFGCFYFNYSSYLYLKLTTQKIKI